MKDEYVKILYKLAKKAYKKNEVPVSAILVYDNKIIAKSYNQKNLKNNSMYHAEILCLNKAYKKFRNWNLNGCIMYVTLEPCSLCKLAIEESRIDKVYYLLDKSSYNNRYKKTKYEQTYGDFREQFIDLMKDFFKNIRKK